MINKLKKSLYFTIARYFRFWAEIRLNKWKPVVIVVTGSSGKTTLLHMLEAQLGDRAIFSHHANSAYGIPFFILDLHRTSYQNKEWLKLFLTAPLNAFKKPPSVKIFVVEADTDRWGEGKFLAEFLRPDVVLWTSVGRTHSQNFENILKKSNFAFKSVDEAIAYDFGYFLEYCKNLVVLNADSELIKNQESRAGKQLVHINKKKSLNSYKLIKDKTSFEINGENFIFNALLPEEIFYSIVMCREVCKYLEIPFDEKFSKLILPPGRSSIFKGIKNITLIDSSYNANLSSMKAILNMFSKIPGDKKWVVLGDMLELGAKEQEEHEELGKLLYQMSLEKIILIGGRVGEYTFKLLSQKLKDKNKKRSNDQVIKCSNRNQAFSYIKENISGGETVLFKASASMHLEEIIENLLADKKDAEFLPRQGAFWDSKRK